MKFTDQYTKFGITENLKLINFADEPKFDRGTNYVANTRLHWLLILVAMSAGLAGCSSVRQEPAKQQADQAHAAYLQGDWGQAEKFYTKALQAASPDYRAQLHSERGICRQNLGNDGQAREDYEKCIELEPNSYQYLHLNIAEMDYRSGAFTEGLKQVALAKDDLRIGATKHFLSSLGLYALKRYNESLTEANKSLAICDDTGETSKNVHLNRVSLYELLGEHAKAQAELSVVRNKYVAEPHPFESMTFYASRKFPARFESSHFIVYTHKNLAYCKRIAEQLEAYVNWFSREFFPVPKNMLLVIFIAKNEEKQKDLLSIFAKARTGDQLRQYFPDYNCLVTNEDEGFDFYFNEVTHRILEFTTPALEPWAREGVPAFFEQVYGYESENPGKSEFICGFQNNARIKALDDKIEKLDIKKICYEMNKEQQDVGANRLVVMFLHRQKALKRFLRIIAALEPSGGHLTPIEDALDKDFDRIQPMWKEYLADVQRRKGVFEMLPDSEMFATEDDFKNFYLKNKYFLGAGY